MRESAIRLDDLMPVIRERLAAGEAVRFSPHGTSMLPMLRDGRDQVILSAVTGRLKKYDLPLYQRENGQYVLHRVVRVEDTYTCMGDNQFVPEPDLRHEQMIAVVTGFYRDEKYHSVTQWRYRLYCRLWYNSRGARLFWRRGIGWIRRHL